MSTTHGSAGGGCSQRLAEGKRDELVAECEQIALWLRLASSRRDQLWDELEQLKLHEVLEEVQTSYEAVRGSALQDAATDLVDYARPALLRAC